MSLGRVGVYVIATAVVATVAFFIGSSVDTQPLISGNNASHASNSPILGSLTIVTLVEGELANGAVYRIFPDPFESAGNYTVQDGEIEKDSSPIGGIITLDGLSDGTFSVIQITGPVGMERDIIPKVITIATNSSELVTFGTNPQDKSGQKSGSGDLGAIESVLYASKFECGTIRGSEGPLRPGHYDTDIGIYNKQDFPVRITWNAAANDDEPANALVKTLASHTATNIVCNDMRKLIGTDSDFSEGYVIVEVPVDPRLRASISGSSSVLDNTFEDKIDILEVQTFYTANALDELPHSIMVDKISFVIRANTTIGGFPDSMLGTLLDVTLPSVADEISNPEEKVRAHIAQKYNVTSSELAAATVEIRSVDVGVGTMIDDHAISLSKVRPQPKMD